MFGQSTTEAGQLLDSASNTWSIAALVDFPLFDAAQRRAEVEAARSAKRAAALSYEQAVLAAFADTERAAAGLRSAREARRLADANYQARTETLARARDRDRAGLGDEIDLIEARRRAVGSDIERIAARAAELEALLSVYAALGGSY